MQVTQISPGRFHHFHLARQLEKASKLAFIYTGYPKYKLRDELCVPESKIKTMVFYQMPYMAFDRIKLNFIKPITSSMSWLAWNELDKFVSSRITEATNLIALSGAGLISGARTQKMGGKYICDRGSTHIQFQNNLLHDEYERFGAKWSGSNERLIEKELEEYQLADKISVPSQFCYNSFMSMGVPESKLVKIPYGARLDRFYPVNLALDHSVFHVLFVGQVSLRKGFLDLLHGFQMFSHPHKKLTVIGAIDVDIKPMLSQDLLKNVDFLGLIGNNELQSYYARSHAFVLPSIEEGLAMVMGEALASGCPVIATPNSGAEELIKDREEGFIIPIRSARLIADRLTELADNPDLQQSMSRAAVACVSGIGGWDEYGDKWIKVLDGLDAHNFS